MTYQLKLVSACSFLKATTFSALLATSSLGVSSALASAVNVNTATQTELESIKGIGPSKAKTTIAERLDVGHFQDANDLQKRVRGIGIKSVEKMVDNGLTIESPNSFRGSNSKIKKGGASSSRRSSCGQSSSRSNPDCAGGGHRN